MYDSTYCRFLVSGNTQNVLQSFDTSFDIKTMVKIYANEKDMSINHIEGNFDFVPFLQSYIS